MQEVHLIEVNDASHIGQARRLAMYLAGTMDFNEIEKTNATIIATEMATNIIKHARFGKIILMTKQLNQHKTLEIVAMDQGPGIANVSHSITDGISTTQTLGIGMGALQRLATHFDLYSSSQHGTVLWSEIIGASKEKSIASEIPCKPYKMGVLSIPIKNEEYCGDGWSIQPLYSDVVRILISDGLGHGFGAYQATSKAIECFHTCQSLCLYDALMDIHAALKKTRGAAISLVEINFSKGTLDYVGVGNISGKIIGHEKSISMVSTPGIAGHICSTIKVFTYPFEKGNLLLLFSDGLTNRWNFNDYAGLLVKHPAVIAGVLYRDYQREKDDATIFAIKY